MTTEYHNKLKHFINEIMTAYQGQGIGVLGFDKDQILFFETLGYKDMTQKDPINLDTIFGIASISKSFTNIGLLKLVERGLVDLDQDIDIYFPQLKLPKGQMPKIRDLMSHTGGFYPQERFLMNEVSKAIGLDDETEKSESKALFEKGLDMIINRLNEAKDFTGIPGQYHSYSNFSYGLLTALIQKLSDEKNYVRYMENQVFKSMGLNRTFFSFNKTKDIDNITKLYEPVLDHINTLDDYTDQGFVLLGGGAIKSTFNDLMTYTRLYLNQGFTKEGNRLIGPEYLGEMTKAHVNYKPYEYYGLGLVGGSFNNISYAGHSGGLTGVSSYFGFTKETGKGVVVLCNTSNVPVSPIGIAALKYLNGIEPDWKLEEFTPCKWTEDELQMAVGVYTSDEGGKIEISRTGTDGLKYLNGATELSVDLLPNMALKVFNKVVWSYSPFVLNEDGRVKAIYSGSRMLKKKD